MGGILSFLSESFPPKSNFHPDDIPDLTGKVIIVTGASSGIGRETAKALLDHNAKVYIATYNADKAANTISELKEETGNEAIFIKLDLADLKSIKAAAEEFSSKERELHVLFNNAGIFRPPVERLTAQGYDAQFGVHVVGHFYLTKLLLPALIAGAKSSPDGKSRVVNTASSASLGVTGINFNTLKESPLRKEKGGQFLYGQSKLGNILFSNELARRYGDQGIVSTALNPGNIKSDIQRNLPGWGQWLFSLVTYDEAYGPLTQLWAGTAPETAEMNGKYLIPWARLGTSGKSGRDPQLAKELWTWLEEQIAQNA
ncbi:hypothetical protein HYPSUDRAFT_134827 [Hypholoma sublateritium FD-334 SS-4]|uniref:NAD(P)-binding protein n=1 Tax=Hypholoma sublateritium (strain FD-334 SS-4) TaxID=945553 RepID=A0A0D2MP10_HYPSF|nr:hypothetical protein HYPSUDRAFT_134827 [Hypholoma sublateritium FD-334 SS-4]